MKLIALFVLCVAAALAVGYVKYVDEFEQTSSVVIESGQWVWENVRANPVPVTLALGTFLLTVAYHKAKGKSLRESVEVAATRVAVIPVAVADSQDEHPVVKRCGPGRRGRSSWPTRLACRTDSASCRRKF